MDPYFTTRQTGDPARSMKLPLYCYWKFHCCSAINRLSFNMFLLVTRKCMSESVHFYHTSSILMSFWYIVLKNLSFLRGCKIRFISIILFYSILSFLACLLISMSFFATLILYLSTMRLYTGSCGTFAAQKKM